jgi:hypothetical protein
MIQDRLKEGRGEFMMEIGLEGTNTAPCIMGNVGDFVP